MYNWATHYDAFINSSLYSGRVCKQDDLYAGSSRLLNAMLLVCMLAYYACLLLVSGSYTSVSSSVSYQLCSSSVYAGAANCLTNYEQGRHLCV